MKLGFIIFSLLVSCSRNYGQNFDKAYFTKTDWFTNNDSDHFNKSDTIKLIKHNICNSPSSIQNYCESEKKQFDHGNIIQITLDRKNKMNFITKHGNGWSIRTGNQQWFFDEDKNLVFKYRGKVTDILKPISSQQISVKTDYDNEILTTELTLIRVKNYR